jgi:hypothetical protein
MFGIVWLAVDNAKVFAGVATVRIATVGAILDLLQLLANSTINANPKSITRVYDLIDDRP